MGGSSSKADKDAQNGDRQSNEVNVDPKSTTYDQSRSSSGIHIFEVNLPSLGLGVQVALWMTLVLSILGIVAYSTYKYFQKKERDALLHEYYTRQVGLDNLLELGQIGPEIPTRTIRESCTQHEFRQIRQRKEEKARNERVARYLESRKRGEASGSGKAASSSSVRDEVRRNAPFRTSTPVPCKTCEKTDCNMSVAECERARGRFQQ